MRHFTISRARAIVWHLRKIGSASQVIIILARVATLLLYFFPHAVIVPIKPESILHRNNHAFGIVTPDILPFGRLATIFIGSGSNSPAFPNASTLKLLQYGQEFGSAHALHSDIVAKGSGRFSHWGDNVVFSTPDNTSAVDNGRIYAVAHSISPRWWIPISLLAIGVLWLWHTLTSARESPQDGGQSASHYGVRANPAEDDTAAMD